MPEVDVLTYKTHERWKSAPPPDNKLIYKRLSDSIGFQMRSTDCHITLVYHLKMPHRVRYW